ncbi:exodeoxyribonuclease VII large subunit [Hazenella sp. IB182353]|uniref:exodeoxyribonuclease VII large subunit n=1 Tax=Polycladospora coralii TaxID=2771432 RepID=UPI00174623FF|nr:exodeoxyribonuclease VII large subunit [Polycladospora coralii]MBS7530909.1 exodeoxyribonuclease VII large subunit [Polycladospora coralii]
MSSTSEKEIWSVHKLNTYLLNQMNQDEILQKLWIEGEISNFSQHRASKHMYFTLKDEHAKIKAAMFAGQNRRLRFKPQNGDRVLIRGNVSLYDREGQLQLYVQDMRQSGMGDLHIAFERLKEQLLQEGLFSRSKKQLPDLPRTVGVITSAHGAAVRDIVTTMKRRYPLTHVLIYPVAVQGINAATEIAHAIDEMNRLDECDVLIIGRGGGSIEELWAFNEEVVARSIDRSSIPIISAVGHETDTTISDFVADCRAATPTAAAELVVPHQIDMRERLDRIQTSMRRTIQNGLLQRQKRLQTNMGRPVFQQPNARLYQYAQRLDDLYMRLGQAYKGLVKDHRSRHQLYAYRLQAEHPMKRLKLIREKLERFKQTNLGMMQQHIERDRNHLTRLISNLDALSPLRVMQRGYAIVHRHGSTKLIKSYQDVKPGDLIRVRLAEGQLKCQIWKTEEVQDE